MSTVGRDIENAIQSLIKISEEYAGLQAKLTKATGDLSMLDTLFSVSKYIGSDIETESVLLVLEDGVKGVFGAAHSAVVFDKSEQHLTRSPIVYDFFTYNQLLEKVDDYIFLEQNSGSDITTYGDGPVLILRLAVGEETYGFLTILWNFNYAITDSQIIFLRIIANQVSIYLKGARLVEMFKQRAVIDSLTGIFNRAYFSNIESTTLPVIGESILMFDLDKFKRINDNFGHQYGDKILKQFANILTEVTQEFGGTAFKYGGEEFVIKLDEGGEDLAFKLAETVRQRFEKETSYTVSAGVSTCGTSCNVSSYNQLIESADEALYVSKGTGRNRTTISNSDIQVFTGANYKIEKLVGSVSRDKSISSMYRLAFDGNNIINEQEFSKLKQMLGRLTRLTDDVVLTPSLDAIVFMDGYVDDNLFITRINNVLSAEMPNVVYSVKSIADSTVKLIEKNHLKTSIAIEFADRVTDMKDVPIQLRVLGQWHKVSEIFSINSSNNLINKRLIAINIIKQLPVLGELITSYDNLYFEGDMSKLGNSTIPFSVRLFSLVEAYTTYIEMDKRRKLGEKSFTSFAKKHHIDDLDMVKSFCTFIKDRESDEQ